MKKYIIIPFLFLLLLFLSCKKELAKEPKRLIAKEKMVDIMYDLSLINAMRSHDPTLLDSFKNNSNSYIYKKHKIDSLQFVQSNSYYAADYKEYQKMYEEVNLRLKNDKLLTEAAIKAEAKRAILLKKKNKKRKEKTVADSIKKAKVKMAKEIDSLKKILSEEKKRRVQLK